MNRTTQNSGTVEVREALRFDAGRLDAWLRENVAGYSGPLAVEQFRGGQANPTYKLLTPARSYVLRRKPPGKLLPGAHAVDREYRVIRALAGQGFPVARAHGLCEDEAVIGTPFYVMDFVSGRIFWETDFPQVGRDERPAYFDAMNATIARLHGVDPAAIVHGIKGRVVRGTAASSHAAQMAASLEGLAELAWMQAVKAGAKS